MSSTAATPANAGTTRPNWNEIVSKTLAEQGLWPTYQALVAEIAKRPDDLSLRGYCEIIRSMAVKDFLAAPKGLSAAPRLTAEFLTDFARFNLSAQEGYLISLIDGRITIQSLLKLSPFDPFTSLFTLARLQFQRAIAIPT